MQTNRARAEGLTWALGAAMVSGVAVFVNRSGVSAVRDATVYTTAKNLIAALILVFGATTIAVLRQRSTAPVGAGRGPIAPAEPGRWGRLLGLGVVALVGGAVAFVLFFEGLTRGSATQAAFVQKTLVIWVAILAVPLLSERLRLPHYLAIGLLLCGQVLITDNLTRFRLQSGQVLVLAATLMWAVETVIVKRLLASTPVQVVAIARMAGGSVILIAWLAATGRWHDLVTLDARGWGWAAATGTILAGYVSLWFTALSKAPAIDVTAIGVLAAVITAILDALSGKQISLVNASGLLLLCLGAAVAALARPGSGSRRQGVPVG